MILSHRKFKQMNLCDYNSCIIFISIVISALISIFLFDGFYEMRRKTLLLTIIFVIVLHYIIVNYLNKHLLIVVYGKVQSFFG